MSSSTPEATPRVAAVRWPATEEIKHGANVVLGFHGLMGFCHRHDHSDRNCEIGIHNHSIQHNLRITVYSVSDTFDPPHQMDMRPYQVVGRTYVKGDTGSLSTNIVSFDVSKPRFSGVSYFQSGDEPRSHRWNFRHILDLEHDIYGGKVLGKKPTRMGPRLRVKHAVFYTLCRSETEFKRVEATNPPSNPSPIGKLARLVGANIYLKNDGKVTLKMPGADDVPMSAKDGKFFVLIDNGCEGCEDNDFHLYYDTFDIPETSPVFNVEKMTPGIPAPAPGSPCELIEQIVKPRTSDDTPCGAAGFGSSGGLE